ncbi:MAG TPA: BamA/TamA family outer membrane protein [Bacteroidales bacterium]|nr:BamA/TamA family outer membrane protein [Bacteroidales bacterium]
MLLIVLSSCNPTKYVPAGKTLLDKNEINLNKDYVKKSSIIPYIKQKPNETIFGTRFYLWLYNLSNINKTRWPHSWLRRIGEEPVIFDPDAATRSVAQIKSYVTSKGYFDGRVSDSVKTTDSRTSVYYNVNLLPAYTIRNLYYEIKDTLIRQFFNFDSVNCLIKRGKPYDVDVLQAERARFERFIRNQGYYAFSSEYISFEADSTVGHRQVDLYYNIRNNVSTDIFNRTTILPHQIYQVRNIYIYPDYNPATALQEGEAYLGTLDTIQYKGYYFITSNKNPTIRYDLILQTLYLKPGSVFNLTNRDQTESHLKSLKVYRLVNINYSDVKEISDSMSISRSLDCNIMLTLLTPQSYRVELEGTHSSGNLGGAVNLVYQHKNLFHGAELFSVTLGGSYEALKQKGRLRSIREFGLETSLRLPQFLLPFLKSEDFIKKYNPSTNIVAAYNFQAMPLFTRTLASATFGYTWKSGRYITHIVNPLQLNLVKLPPGSMDPIFAERIKSTYLAYSYRDVLILGGGYSFIFNNQSIQNSRDYTFFRMNFESAGNMNSLIGALSGREKWGDTTTYKFLGQPYAQYFRIDGDLRYNYSLNEVSSIVYRAFVGVGIPYGNSRAIPFEKQYFAGGANSIRAWQVRTLGPGSYDAGDPDTTFLNQTADIKIELNAEYRFKLFWIMEGALFLDAGNIWTYNSDPARPGTKFSIKEKKTPEGTVIHKPFYNDIALGTGFGLRFDFKFVIGRLDLGMKLRDPRAGQGWILGNRPYTRRDFALVLGIGYPF